MINISRSPLRISFFGGGTDYPTYFNSYPGAVLGGSIDKYIYTIALPMADFAENRYRITYRIVEVADRVQDIKHNVIRATLLEMGYDEPLKRRDYFRLARKFGTGKFVILYCRLHSAYGISARPFNHEI